MAPDQEPADRDAAVRTMLVERVTRPERAPAIRLAPGRMRSGLVTAVVLVVIVALTVLAVRFGADRSAPADGGVPVPPSLPSMTIPAGKVLGHYTSADGPVQTHTIHPDGLALATVFACSGGGARSRYMIHIPHYEDEGGGCSGGSGGSGNKGLAGAVTLTITTTRGTHWTYTVVGIPETYVTPRPVPTPTTSDGVSVPYCTAADLSARFAPGTMPKGVTEVSGGDLVFTNTSTVACALAGYPEVRFIEGSSPLGHNTMNQIDERSSTEHGLRAVILAPHGRAYSQVGWYLPGGNAKEEGPCVARQVTRVQVDLAYDLAGPGQTGTLDVPIGKATACLNGAHGALGKYGQISSTVFVDYASTGR